MKFPYRVKDFKSTQKCLDYVAPGLDPTVGGRVSSTGAVVAGRGFTAVRTGVGVYVVTITGKTVISASANSAAGAGFITTVNAYVADGFTVNIFFAGAAADSDFSFICAKANP